MYLHFKARLQTEYENMKYEKEKSLEIANILP
jgi:hypothetical protein